MTIQPIILCGGKGSRLWPSSRQSFPKQFAPLTGERTPYQELLIRCAGEGFAAPVVATHADFRFLATDQAQEVGLWDANVLVEPEGRDTAASVLAAALKSGDDPETLYLVTPVAHFTGSDAAFREAVLAAAETVRGGTVVLFSDDAAEAEAEQPVARVAGGASQGLSVVPAPRRAGCAAGMALMRREELIAAYEAVAPELIEPCRRAVEQGAPDLGFFRYDAEAYAGLPEMSFAHDILPGSARSERVSLGGTCTDIEDWNAIWSMLGPDERGVSTRGEAMAVECRDSLLQSDDDTIQVLGVGLNNVVAVAMRDAVLVADRSRLDAIPGALERLSARGRKQAAEYPRYHRPWGWYESLVAGTRFQVKRIMVKPGGVLSLQSHVHRSEHWIVVSGTAEVTIGEEVKLVPENGSVYIPVGTVHRMANPGKVPMYLIEVQTGSYFGEDDIRRYEDIYDRC